MGEVILGKKQVGERILVTGGRGFLGSHIIKYLSGLGYNVDYFLKEDFIAQNWSHLDGVKTVIHCAWCTDKDLQSIEHMEFAEWTCNFFDECKKRGIRVINLGSSSEYGVKYEAMREDMMCEPVNAYGIAKLSVTLYAKLLGYNTLRIFSPYGEGGKNFVSLKDKVEKYGNPLDRRDYFPVELVCHAVERLLHAKHLYGEVINVCRGIWESNRDYVNPFGYGDVEKIVGPKWFKYPQRQYEPSVWVGSTDKMKKLLNL